MDVWPSSPQDRVSQSASRAEGLRDERADALLAVQHAVERHARDDTPQSTLRPSLDALGNLARSEGMPPEQLIIELKQALNQMPALARLDPLVRSDIAARVVLLAIEAYYGDGTTSPQ
jgi:hypothetical protein